MNPDAAEIQPRAFQFLEVFGFDPPPVSCSFFGAPYTVNVLGHFIYGYEQLLLLFGQDFISFQSLYEVRFGEDEVFGELVEFDLRV